MVCVDEHDIPIVAIVDTELMASMPKSIAASTGMDALTSHCRYCGYFFICMTCLWPSVGRNSGHEQTAAGRTSSRGVRSAVRMGSSESISAKRRPQETFYGALLLVRSFDDHLGEAARKP